MPGLGDFFPRPRLVLVEMKTGEPGCHKARPGNHGLSRDILANQVVLQNCNGRAGIKPKHIFQQTERTNFPGVCAREVGKFLACRKNRRDRGVTASHVRHFRRCPFSLSPDRSRTQPPRSTCLEIVDLSLWIHNPPRFRASSLTRSSPNSPFHLYYP